MKKTVVSGKVIQFKSEGPLEGRLFSDTPIVGEFDHEGGLFVNLPQGGTARTELVEEAFVAGEPGK